MSERYTPVDIFVLQPARVIGINSEASEQNWGTGQYWKVIYSVDDLVTHVQNMCGDDRYIRMLRIGGHGHTDRFRIGDQLITLKPVNDDPMNKNFPLEDAKPTLAKIIPYFKEDKSFVVLDHCRVGQGEALLKGVSQAFGGVPVLAPLGDQGINETPPRLEGTAKLCNDKFCLTVNQSRLATLGV